MAATRINYRYLLLLGYLSIAFVFATTSRVSARAAETLEEDVVLSLEQVREAADDALSDGDTSRASEMYRRGIHYWETAIQHKSTDYSLITVLTLYTNGGTAFSTLDDTDMAIDLYAGALDTYQTEIGLIIDKDVRKDATDIAAQAAFYLGMVYQDLEGKDREAIATYKYAARLDPLHWASLANAASVYHDRLRQHDIALELYDKAFSVLTSTTDVPTDPPEEPAYILSQLQYRMGLCFSSFISPDSASGETSNSCVIGTEQHDCTSLATHSFSVAIEYDPENEAARHMLASLTADATIHRASNSYVKQLFDEYAASFEHSLVEELQYTGYERLRRGFDRSGVKGSEDATLFDLVVDAGCGTGLVGEQFRNVSRTLIGVDLSAAIVAQAHEARPGLYDETIVGDILAAFRDRAPIDLIVAADSYIYFGDLDPLFAAMYEGLAEGGFAAFTLENASDEKLLDTSKPDWRWQLTASGRFAHRKDYVVTTAKQHSMDVIHYEPLNGKWIGHGRYCILISTLSRRFSVRIRSRCTGSSLCFAERKIVFLQ